MLKTPRISIYADMPEEERQMQVCALAEGDTWMTPYKRYLADGLSQWSLKRVRRLKEMPQGTLWWTECCSGTVSLTLIRSVIGSR